MRRESAERRQLESGMLNIDGRAVSVPVEMHISIFEIVVIHEVAATIVVVEMEVIGVPISIGVWRIWGRSWIRLGKCYARDGRYRSRDN